MFKPLGLSGLITHMMIGCVEDELHTMNKLPLGLLRRSFSGEL